MPASAVRRIIVRYHGGLGNQIFQYACSLYFAERFSVPLEIVMPVGRPDALHSKGFARPFHLNQFCLETHVRPYTQAERLFLSSRPIFTTARHALRPLLKPASIDFLEEQQAHHFVPTLLDNAPAQTVYMIGFWQAAGYAQAVASRLRKTLRLKHPPLPLNLGYADQIHGLRCPVSVHVRLGDYALHTADVKGATTGVTWVLRRSYYLAAMANVRARLPDAEFVLFSDDPEGALAMLKGQPIRIVVKGNTPATAIQELWLMSCCKHHIIANSSFSWWGAWMNPHPQKLVIAPKYWFNTHESYFPELLPPDWTAIDNLA